MGQAEGEGGYLGGERPMGAAACGGRGFRGWGKGMCREAARFTQQSALASCPPPPPPQSRPPAPQPLPCQCPCHTTGTAAPSAAATATPTLPTAGAAFISDDRSRACRTPRRSPPPAPHPPPVAFPRFGGPAVAGSRTRRAGDSMSRSPGKCLPRRFRIPQRPQFPDLVQNSFPRPPTPTCTPRPNPMVRGRASGGKGSVCPPPPPQIDPPGPPPPTDRPGPPSPIKAPPKHPPPPIAPPPPSPPRGPSANGQGGGVVGVHGRGVAPPPPPVHAPTPRPPRPRGARPCARPRRSPGP